MPTTTTASISQTSSLALCIDRQPKINNKKFGNINILNNKIFPVQFLIYIIDHFEDQHTTVNIFVCVSGSSLILWCCRSEQSGAPLSYLEVVQVQFVADMISDPRRSRKSTVSKTILNPFLCMTLYQNYIFDSNQDQCVENKKNDLQRSSESDVSQLILNLFVCAQLSSMWKEPWLGLVLRTGPDKLITLILQDKWAVCLLWTAKQTTSHPTVFSSVTVCVCGHPCICCQHEEHTKIHNFLRTH